MTKSYPDFSASPAGRKLDRYLATPEVIAAMEAASRAGEPAVAAIDRWVAAEMPPLDNTEKQHVGRMVRDRLTPRAWRKAKQDRLKNGHIFSSGAVYVRVVPSSGPDEPKPCFHERSDGLDGARALLAAGRRDRERPLGSVEAFLAERRALWGGA